MYLSHRLISIVPHAQNIFLVLYDVVLCSWVEKSMGKYGVAINMRHVNNGNMMQWNAELISGDQRLGNSGLDVVWR